MSEPSEVGSPCGPGEEALLSTANEAQVLSEGLNSVMLRLYDFADWQLLNVTEAEACVLDPDLASLRSSFCELARRAEALVAEMDAWCGGLGGDWPDSDELFVLSMARLGNRGDPRWRELAAWWQSTCAQLDDRCEVDPEGPADAAVGVLGRG